jgi:ribose transport system substrate-binding protein
MIHARSRLGRRAVGRLAVSLAIGVLAAGCSTGGTQPAASSAPASAATQDPISISHVTGLKGLPFFTSVHCGAQSRADELGIKYDYDGPAEFDATLQIPILNAVGARGPDAMIVSPTDTQALIAPMQGLVDQGIKLVTVDTTVTDASVTVSRILSDNVAGGKLGAETLAKLTGGKGSVVILGVKPGISTTDERSQGFEEAIKTFPDIKYLGIEYNQGSNATAQQVLTGVLAANPDLSGIFIPGNVGSEGAAAALRSANLGGKVKVVQYDASPPQIDQLKQGVLDALIAQDPYQEGRDAVDQALNAVTGEAVTAEVLTGLNVITKEAVETDGPKYQYKTDC